jgi:hypothetical protein
MTQCISPDDPQYFTETSSGLYDRHKYKLYLTNGKSIVFDDYESLRVAWFQTDSKFLQSVEVLDINKGFN